MADLNRRTLDLADRDAIDAELAKLDWLVSIAMLAGTYIEDRDPEPGGWRMMQNVAYHLSSEIAVSRIAIAKTLEALESHPMNKEQPIDEKHVASAWANGRLGTSNA